MKANVYGKCMKNLTIKNLKGYENLWHSVERAKPAFILWQLEAEGNRRVKFFKFNLRKTEKSELHLVEQETQDSPFSMQDLYAYCEEFGFIFKTQISAISGQDIFLMNPVIIKLLEEDDVQFIQGLSEMDFSSAPWRVKKLDNTEEEEVYTAFREAPRARPKADKKVSLYKSGEAERREEFTLFDISRGGLSFLVEKEDKFLKGEYLEIASLEGEELDVILIGEIMSIRSQGESWKVGIKFIDKIPTHSA